MFFSVLFWLINNYYRAKIGFVGKYSEKLATSIATFTTGDGGSKTMSVSYLQSVLPNLRVICRNDLSLAKKSPMGGEKDWVSVWKIKKKEWKRMKERKFKTCFIVSLSYSIKVLRLGYQARFPSSQIEVNGLLDSTGNVQCLYSMPLINTQMTLSGSVRFFFLSKFIDKISEHTQWNEKRSFSM